MVEFEIVVLTGRYKSDVAVSWMLQHAGRAVVGEREKANVTWVRVRYSQMTTELALDSKYNFGHTGYP
jgi:hypothetical protein